MDVVRRLDRFAQAPQSRRIPGFVIIELLMVMGIVGVLSTIAVASYNLYVMRGQLAQTLVDYGHIRSIVNVESYDSDNSNLQLGSVPGEVPPALKNLLSQREFNQMDGIKLQLVKAPAGTFASFPNKETYALIASAGDAAGARRLRLLRNELPHNEGDKLWLSEQELYFPLNLGEGNSPGGTVSPAPLPVVPPSIPVPSNPPPTPPSTPETGWDNPESSASGNTWTAGARICVTGTDGQKLTGVNAQVQLRVVQEVRTWNGQSTERSWVTQVALTDGCATFEQSGAPIPASGQEGVSAFRFEVLDVIYYWPTNPAIKWDGVKPVIRIESPA